MLSTYLACLSDFLGQVKWPVTDLAATAVAACAAVANNDRLPHLLPYWVLTLLTTWFYLILTILIISPFLE